MQEFCCNFWVRVTRNSYFIDYCHSRNNSMRKSSARRCNFPNEGVFQSADDRRHNIYSLHLQRVQRKSRAKSVPNYSNWNPGSLPSIPYPTSRVSAGVSMTVLVINSISRSIRGLNARLSRDVFSLCSSEISIEK